MANEKKAAIHTAPSVPGRPKSASGGALSVANPNRAAPAPRIRGGTPTADGLRRSHRAIRTARRMPSANS